MEEKYFVGGYVDSAEVAQQIKKLIEANGKLKMRREIHGDYEFECTVEDVRDYLDGNDEQLTDEQIERAARLVMRDIGNSDARAEAYWMSFENAIDEVREEDEK